MQHRVPSKSEFERTPTEAIDRVSNRDGARGRGPGRVRTRSLAGQISRRRPRSLVEPLGWARSARTASLSEPPTGELIPSIGGGRGALNRDFDRPQSPGAVEAMSEGHYGHPTGHYGRHGATDCVPAMDPTDTGPRFFHGRRRESRSGSVRHHSGSARWRHGKTLTSEHRFRRRRNGF